MKHWLRANWVFIVFLFVIVFFVGWKWWESNSVAEVENTWEITPTDDAAMSQENDITDKPKSTQFVDVKGEVVNPDIYEITGQERVKDIIQLAGGFTDDADTTNVNLAQKVMDEMVITIPKKGELVNGTDSSEASSALVNINQATKEEIETLPGIGSVKAESIIQHREEKGFFQSISDLEDVSGIGEKTVEKLEEYISIP